MLDACAEGHLCGPRVPHPPHRREERQAEDDLRPPRREDGARVARAGGLRSEAPGATRRDEPRRRSSEVEVGRRAPVSSISAPSSNGRRSRHEPRRRDWYTRRDFDQPGRLAQLVRAPALQAGGRWFEPGTAHHDQVAGAEGDSGGVPADSPDARSELPLHKTHVIRRGSQGAPSLGPSLVIRWGSDPRAPSEPEMPTREAVFRGGMVTVCSRCLV